MGPNVGDAYAIGCCLVLLFGVITFERCASAWIILHERSSWLAVKNESEFICQSCFRRINYCIKLCRRGEKICKPLCRAGQKFNETIYQHSSFPRKWKVKPRRLSGLPWHEMMFRIVHGVNCWRIQKKLKMRSRLKSSSDFRGS